MNSVSLVPRDHSLGPIASLSDEPQIETNKKEDEMRYRAQSIGLGVHDIIGS
jgi:hypothetical protein